MANGATTDPVLRWCGIICTCVVTLAAGGGWVAVDGLGDDVAAMRVSVEHLTTAQVEIATQQKEQLAAQHEMDKRLATIEAQTKQN